MASSSVLYQDYFEILGLEKKFVVDEKQLRERFLHLQTIFHPDRYMNTTAQEKKLVLARSTLLNQAYQTLKDNLKRAEYLIVLAKQQMSFQESSIEPQFLLEIMEVREILDELKDKCQHGDLSAKERILQIVNQYRQKKAEIIIDIDAMFKKVDEKSISMTDAAIQLNEWLNRLRYYQGIIEIL